MQSTLRISVRREEGVLTVLLNSNNSVRRGSKPWLGRDLPTVLISTQTLLPCIPRLFTSVDSSALRGPDTRVLPFVRNLGLVDVQDALERRLHMHRGPWGAVSGVQVSIPFRVDEDLIVV